MTEEVGIPRRILRNTRSEHLLPNITLPQPGRRRPQKRLEHLFGRDGHFCYRSNVSPTRVAAKPQDAFYWRQVTQPHGRCLYGQTTLTLICHGDVKARVRILAAPGMQVLQPCRPAGTQNIRNKMACIRIDKRSGCRIGGLVCRCSIAHSPQGQVGGVEKNVRSSSRMSGIT